MTQGAEGSQKVEAARPAGCFVALVRFVGWLCLTICALALVGLASVYVPCFTGEAGACISGVLLLFGGLFVLAFGGVGLLLLVLTRRRPRNV